MPSGGQLKLNHVQVIELLELYSDPNNSICSIAEHFGILGETVRGYVERAELQRIPRSNKYTVDVNSFDTINEHSAYWVGFLMADGNISNRCIRICLQPRDKEHLYKFREFLKSNHPVKEITTTLGYSGVLFDIVNAQLVRTLATYNVIPAKSLIATTPATLLYNRHYWRGVFDGDGSIEWHKTHHKKSSGREYHYVRPCISLVGSENIVKEFADFISAELDYTLPVSPFNHSEAFRTRTSGLKATAILDLLYDNCTVSLDRKHLQASEAFLWNTKNTHLQARFLK